MKEYVYGMYEGSYIDGQDACSLENDSEGAGVFLGGWSLVTTGLGPGKTQLDIVELCLSKYSRQHGVMTLWGGRK
jgi:hypothetical protein